MFVSAAMLAFTACSDDDDDVVKDNSVTAKYELTVKLSDAYMKNSDVYIVYNGFDGNSGKKKIDANGTTLQLTATEFPTTVEVAVVDYASDGEDDVLTSANLSVEVSQSITAYVGKTATAVAAGSYNYSDSQTGVTVDNAESVVEKQWNGISKAMGRYTLTLNGTTVTCAFTPQDDLYDDEDYEVDDLEYFTGRLLSTNSDGSCDYKIGTVLNAYISPYALSVGVKSYEEAVEIFKTWFYDDDKLKETASGWSYEMTDADGNSEGTIILQKEDGTDGLVASVVFADGAKVEYIDVINFYLSSAWPGNAGTSYKKGDTLTAPFATFKKDSAMFWECDQLLDAYKDKTYYCLNDASNGETAYFVCCHTRCVELLKSSFDPTTDANKAYIKRLREELPTKATMQTIYKKIVEGDFGSYKKFNSWMADKGLELSDEEVWVSDGMTTYAQYKYGVGADGILKSDGYDFCVNTVDLEDGDFEEYTSNYVWRNYTYMTVITKTAN